MLKRRKGVANGLRTAAAPALAVAAPDGTLLAEPAGDETVTPRHDQSACELCISASKVAYWGRSDVTHCRVCGRTWSRTARDAHCVTCHRHFSGTKAFDEHVRNVGHSDPPNERYVLVEDHPTGPTWMSRLNPAFLERMETLRAKE